MMKILIVDDDPNGLYMLEVMLKGSGYEVFAAENGQAALELAGANPPDLIISDILMPVMDGYKLCHEWKKDSRLKNIPFVFYTATYTDPKDEEYALSLGVDRFIAKPVEPEKFIEIIDEIVRACKSGKYAAPGQPIIDETAIIRGHYERMAKKLEDKILELEKANIELKQSEESLRWSQQKLTARNRISTIFLTIPDEEMYEKVLQVILEVMESKYGIFGYIDEHENLVCPSMTRNICDKCRIPNKDIVFPSEKWAKMLGRAMIEKKTICSNKPFSVPEGHIPVTRSMDVPIIHKGEIVGNLLVANKATDYDKNDKELLEIMAMHTAPVLNARLERDRKEKERKQIFEKLQKSLEGTINALASAMRKRDPYTAGHQQRVAKLARVIAKELGLSKDETQGIRVAGIIHDIGKITVPAEILVRPGRLTGIEFSIIRTHSQTGYDILKDIEFPWPVAEIVLQHHERMDGSGYPQGFSGEKIILGAKIMAVADVVEAISSHRPYRPAFPVEKALEEISQNRGILYDTKVVDACLKLFKEKRFRFDKIV